MDRFHRLRIHALDFVASVAPDHTFRERVANVEGSQFLGSDWLRIHQNKRKSPLNYLLVCYQKSRKKKSPCWHLFFCSALCVNGKIVAALNFPKCHNNKDHIYSPCTDQIFGAPNHEMNLTAKAYCFHGQPSPRLAGFALCGSFFGSWKHSARFPFLVWICLCVSRN